MTVEEIINSSGKRYSPYMGGFVNHLPMAQWAIYKMSGEDEEKVMKFTKEYLERNGLDELEKDYKEVKSLEDALGQRDLYQGTLELLKKKVLSEDIITMTKDILNKYKFGMSSGLFHTLIRLAYGVEGYKAKNELEEELLRGLAYYITAYREARLFKRLIKPENIYGEMEALAKDLHIKKILDENETLGQRIKALYNYDKYRDKGFLVKGNGEEKIGALLNLLIPLFYKNNNIVILHCITAIHAMTIVKDYYEDFDEAVDILTSTIITHLITTSIDSYPEMMETKTGFPWTCIREKALKSKNVHDIKLAYSSFKLDETYDIDQFKDISLKRIRHS